MNSRPIYTLSVSKVESFHKFMHRQAEDNIMYNNEETFLATLMGKFVQLPSAKYGECFHAIIEGEAEAHVYTYADAEGNERDIDVMRYKEVMIPLRQAQHAIDYREAHPLMTRELPISKLYHTRNFDLIVTGRVDGLEGNHIRDTKTKYSSPDIQADYIDSFQWRSYLDMLNMNIFIYDIFQVGGFNEVQDCLKARIKPLEPLTLVRYAELSNDVQDAVQEIADYVEFKGLMQYIEISPISTVAREWKLFQDMEWHDGTVLTFGKHRGKMLKDVPQYLQWLYGNQVLPATLRTYIKAKGLV